MASYVIYHNSTEPYTVTWDVNIGNGSGREADSPHWSEYTEAAVGRTIIIYIYPIIIFTGTLGNVLSFAVLMRRSMRDTSVYFYLAMLAIADLCVLYVSGLRAWARQVFEVELLHTSQFGCKSVMLLFLVSLHMSAWLVVAMTVDRFVAVWFPFKASELCVVHRARLVCAVSFVLILVYNLHVLFTVNLHDLGYKLHCGAMRDDYFMTAIFPTMKLVSYSILPFTLVLLFNGAIILRLWLSSSLIRGSHGESARRGTNPQHKITVMLLIVSFVWLVLTGPFTLEPLLRLDGDRGGRSLARLYLSKSICFLMLYTNHSINFYIYCVTGRKFRLQLLEMFWTCCRNSHRGRFSANRLQSNIESRTSRTTNVGRTGQFNGEVIPLKKTVTVTYNNEFN